MKIPKSFKLFGTIINVSFDNKNMNDRELYGESRFSESKIILSETHGVNKLSEDLLIDTFYHEKVHMILNFMQEDKLSSNEKFVDIFAKLLRQSIESEEY